MYQSWRVAGSYLESCNCDAICPCRRVGGVPGGRSTHGECMGALSWLIREGAADSISLAGLATVLVCRYDDDEPGSPWDHWLFVDDRADADQRAALEAIFLGRVGGSTIRHFPWVWKESRLLGVSAAQIEIEHARSKAWFRVRDHVSVRVAGPALDQAPVTCVIPGHDRSGTELVVDALQASAGSMSFSFEGVCAYKSTFDYAGPHT